MNVYDNSDLIRLSAAFTNIDGTPTDPTTVTLRIKQPDGTIIVDTNAGNVVRDAAGNYHYDFAVTQEGNHYYRYEATGALVAAGEGTFRVRHSNVV